MSCTMRSLSRASLAVSASSSDCGCCVGPLRRYALSTSSRVIARPSTTAQVSAEIGVAGAGGVEWHAADTSVIRAKGTRRTRCICRLLANLVRRVEADRHPDARDRTDIQILGL